MTRDALAEKIKEVFMEGWLERGRWGLESQDDQRLPENERFQIDWNNSEAKCFCDTLK